MLLKLFIVKNIVLLTKASGFAKTKYVLILSYIASPFALIIEGVSEWLALNIQFVMFVLGAIAIDHLLGSYVHLYVKKDWSTKENIKGLVTKTLLVIAVYYIGEGIIHILGSTNVVAIYFKMLVQLMVFIYPSGSLIVNSAIVTKGKFPSYGFIKMINQFNKDFDIEVFKQKNKLSD